MLEVYQKSALTFEEQLDLLIKRGMLITDPTYAIQQLQLISYYRLSAYWHPFIERKHHQNKSNQFIPGTQFEDAGKLYEFDRQLRLLVMDAIERIEIHIRTLLTYHLGHTYGAFGYTQASNFHSKFNHTKWLAKLLKETKRSNDVFVCHYKTKYTGFPLLPIWMLTEIMSFGTLSFCYAGLKNEDKRAVATQLGLHHKRLADWLHKLTYIRNLCAHHSRLWNRELAARPENIRDINWNPPITPKKDRVFYILLILRFLLRSNYCGDYWAQQCTKLIEPIAEVQSFRNAMRLTEDWKKHPLWE